MLVAVLQALLAPVAACCKAFRLCEPVLGCNAVENAEPASVIGGIVADALRSC